MRASRAISNAAFAVALIGVYFTPTRHLLLYAPIFLLVPAVGGWLIGSRSAVAVAAVCEAGFCALLIWADHDLYHLTPHKDLGLLTAWRLTEAALGVLVTALGVQISRTRTRSLA